MAFRYYFCLVVLCCSLTAQVFAESVHKAHVEAELILDISTIMPGQPFWVGLQLMMDEGWHTYWRNSGDSGLPTQIKWYLPKGFEAGDIQWSYPKRFDYSQGLTGYGYDGEVILLTEIWPPAELPANEEFQINAQVSWLSCEAICIPGIAHLSLSVNSNDDGAPVNEDIHQLIAEEKQRWPSFTDAWQVSASDKGGTYLLQIAPNMEKSYDIADIAFFPYRNDIIDHSAKQVFRQVKGGYQLTILKTVLLDKTIQRIQGVLISPQGWEHHRREQALFFDVPVN